MYYPTLGNLAIFGIIGRREAGGISPLPHLKSGGAAHIPKVLLYRECQNHELRSCRKRINCPEWVYMS
jgi:hypothetical protein